MQEWRTDEEVAKDERLLSPIKLEAALLLLIALSGLTSAVLTIAFRL